MGCTQSKIENEEAVSRCKDRKQHMKEAVSARNAFAAAHSAYAMALKNTGAALSDYAPGESHPQVGVPPIPAVQTPLDTLHPPPPPPLPQFTDPAPLSRSISMPELPIPKPVPIPELSDTILEEDEDEAEAEAEGSVSSLRHRSRGKSGSSGSRITRPAPEIVVNDDDDGRGDGPMPPPSPPRRDRVRDGVPPPPPSASASASEDSAWEFFFPVDPMPGPTLGEVEEVSIDSEAVERKAFDEKPRKNEVQAAAVESEARAPEKAVEMPPSPSQPQPQTLPVVKAAKKGKLVAVAPSEGRRGGKAGVSVNLVQIFNQLDDAFLKASESAHEVSKMLEANRLHYHSNFADNRGHIDHSARVMRVITWNRSFRGQLNQDDVRDDFDSEEHETHATVLDKLLAWEKKLYDEVKAGELMKFEYQRKVTLLNKQKKHGTNSEALEKTKAAVSHLHTRYIVDMQSLDSTVKEINRLRDHQLYPKLVALVDGMATMWETMRAHHESQSKMVMDLGYLDISQSPKETSEHHHERTIQLWAVVQEWHSQFEKLVNYQKVYIRALSSWLKLNLIPIESSLKEKVSSPPKPQHPPIQALLQAWRDELEKLPHEVAKSAVYNFAAVIHTIVQHQEDEIKLRERCEDTRKELNRKTRQFDDWYSKFMQRRTPSDEADQGPEDSVHNNAIAERRVAVEIVKKRLEEEEEAYQKQCVHVRDKSLLSLKTRLPELFREMCVFSHACSSLYRNLRFISESQNPDES